MYIRSFLSLWNYKSLRNFKNLIRGNGSVLKNDLSIHKSVNLYASELSGHVEIEKNSEVFGSTISGKVEIGHNCKVKDAILKGSISIGRYSSIWGPNIHIYQRYKKIEIGSFCSIARNVSIQEYNHNYNKATSYFIGLNFFKEQWKNETSTNGEISIGHDVWIGANAIISSGVKIGDGSIVAAGAVVTKSFPEYSIIAGVPAKVIGKRFSDEKIELLKKLEWWNWSEEEIMKNKKFFEKGITKQLIQSYLG